MSKQIRKWKRRRNRESPRNRERWKSFSFCMSLTGMLMVDAGIDDCWDGPDPYQNMLNAVNKLIKSKTVEKVSGM